MSPKPVDVFMTGGHPGDGCPISVAAIFDVMLMGTFQEMDERDLFPWAEVIYTGFIGEVGPALVVLDVGPLGIVAMIHDDDGLWSIELTGEFLAMNKR